MLSLVMSVRLQFKFTEVSYPNELSVSFEDGGTARRPCKTANAMIGR